MVTVGKEDRKTHLTYAQEHRQLVAMMTIGAADILVCPCRPLMCSRPVAGTMAANRSGLQMSTIRNLLTAWVLTLPRRSCSVRLLAIFAFVRIPRASSVAGGR